MNTRKAALLVAMVAVMGGLAAFGFAGAAYASQSAAVTCPSSDVGGFALGTDPGDVNTSGNPIFCSYPVAANENPYDFYCTYDAGTGLLVSDHDVGLCPAKAVVGATTVTAASVNKVPGRTVFSARLTMTGTGMAIGGQTIVFKIGPFPICAAVTAPNGIASCTALITLSQYLNANTYTASYAGDPLYPYLPSTATGGFYTARPVLSIP